jgi:hypothetical protein
LAWAVILLAHIGNCQKDASKRREQQAMLRGRVQFRNSTLLVALNAPTRSNQRTEAAIDPMM